MNDTNQTVASSPAYTPMSTKQIVQVGIFGLLAGLIVWGLTFVLQTYALGPLLCRDLPAAECAAAAQYAEPIATVIAAAIALFVLVKLQVFRPLLVVLATVISLWGLVGLVGSLPWYMIGLSTALLYMLSYLLFSWITRVRLFWIVVIILVALIVPVRLILFS